MSNRNDDMVYGSQTGVGYNYWSAMAAQAHPRNLPYVPVYEVKVTSPVKQPLVIANPILQPERPKTPEEIAEHARRSRNRLNVTRIAPWLKRATGHVVSYLTSTGEIAADGSGDLIEGEVVRQNEHIRRLELAYRRFWEESLMREEATKNESERNLRRYEDAAERLRLLSRGLFIAPVDKHMKYDPNLYHFRKSWFGRRKQLKKNKLVLVRAATYDKRLRLFVSMAFSGNCYTRWAIGGRPYAEVSASCLIKDFFAEPSNKVE